MKKKTILIIWSPDAFHGEDMKRLTATLNDPRRGFDAISIMSETAKEDMRLVDLGKLTRIEMQEVRRIAAGIGA